MSKFVEEMKRVTWGGLWLLTFSSVAVATGGAVSMFMYRDAAQKWEARYYHAAGQVEALRAQLQERLQEAVPAEQSARQEIVISVADTEFAPKTLARQNRNWLNVRQPANGDKFVGSIGVDEANHIIFSHPVYSIRAGAMILKNYEKRHGINTLTGIVTRFAEGNRKEYAQFLSKRLGLAPDEPFSIRKRLPELVLAMINFETGERLGAEYISILDAFKE